jgi:dipeptidase
LLLLLTHKSLFLQKLLGEIPQVNQTYNVVGNSNEYGLVIGESTFGGVPQLGQQPGAIIDYGSLIYLALQRCKTAREAISVMDDLMETYGYASSGESISIADRTGEVWLMELIGRGDTYGKKGAVWVAYRIPDGYVTAHANQARITTFPRDKPDHCLYTPDVIDVAVHYGLYPADKDPNDFSFSDIYDPVAFQHARFSEARVWSMFSSIVDNDGSFQLEYQEYASGRDVSKRMPLFVKPYKKLSALDVMALMNSHYEGTELDSSRDVGAGIFESPYRPRPLTWEYQGKNYHNERSVATFRTGWNFLAQIRPEMPRELAAVIWFAVDDSSTSPRVPVYSSSKTIAEPYAGKGTQDGVPGPMLKWDMNKAFWVQNMVSNFCYGRWTDAYPMVRKKIDGIHAEFMEQLKIVDDTAVKLYHNQSADAAVEYVTQYSVLAGRKLHQQWIDFYGELFVRFRDFSTIVPKEGDTRCGCEVQEPGLSEVTKRRIVMETGSHYEIPKEGSIDQRLGAPAKETLYKEIY